MAREWIATIGPHGTEIEVELVSDPGGTHRLRLSQPGGEPTEIVVDAARLGPKSWSLVLGAEGGRRSLVVDLFESGGSRRAQMRGAEVEAVIEDARKKRLAASVGQSGSKSGEVVKAPIAGRVVKVLVAIGDAVEAGHSLVVLEAMKMENELQATREGTVETIAVEAGESVASGQVLVRLV